MAGRRDRGRRPSGRRGEPEKPDYFAISQSDRDFVARARQRTQQKVKRQRLIRLVVLLLVCVAAYFAGPPLVRYLTRQGQQTAAEVQGVGRHIREGVERRAGSELEDQTAR